MRLLALLLLALVGGCSGCASVPSHDELRSLALLLTWDRGEDGLDICGGTPVAADALETAQHCIANAPMAVNGAAVKVKAVEVRGTDRVTITLTEPMFRRWAKIGPQPKQGDRMRWWGNPEGLADAYRVGWVVSVGEGYIAVDAMVCKGDSGSGLFNDAGELVGVVSQRVPEQGKCQFMVARP